MADGRPEGRGGRGWRMAGPRGGAGVGGGGLAGRRAWVADDRADGRERAWVAAGWPDGESGAGALAGGAGVAGGARCGGTKGG